MASARVEVADHRAAAGLFRALRAVGEHATLRIDPAGLSAQATDPAHVAVVRAEMPAGKGVRVDAPPRGATLCVRVASVVRALACVPAAPRPLVLRLEGDRLELEWRGDVEGSEQTFSLHLADADAEAFTIPEREAACVARLPLASLRADLRAVGEASDAAVLECDGERLVLASAEGRGAARVTYRRGFSGAGRASFALRHLVAFAGVQGLDGEVALRISPDFPLVAECGAGGGAARLSLYVAPRVAESEQ